MRFLGNIEARLDGKGRVPLPAAFRKVLQAAGEDTLVLRRHLSQPCLVIYPESVWNERVDQLLANVSPWNDEEEQVVREYVASATELTLDASGRLLLTQQYLDMAGIKQTVRFIGINNTIELWNAESSSGPFVPNGEFTSRLRAIMSKPRSE